MTAICLKRDLSAFVTLASYGAISIMIIALIVVIMGFISFSNTEFEVLSYPGPSLEEA